MSVRKNTGGQLGLRYLLIFTFTFSHLVLELCAGQQQQQQQQQQGDQLQAQQLRQQAGATTLVIRQNGDGISVVDRATNQQLISTSGGGEGEVNANEASLGDQEGLVVAGLLEWLKKKKREKEEKKNQQKQPIILPVPVPYPQPQPLPLPHPQPLPLPLPLPVGPHRHERKEIHIHINNHIKKGHGKKQHGHGKKQHGHGHGHYEDYHDGHYDYHDKHYQGKHSYPLLGHHLSFDHFGGELYGGVGGGGGGGDHHHDSHGGHGDDYSGYESQGVARYAPTASGDSRTETPRHRVATTKRQVSGASTSGANRS